ncbi:polyhydroxyalkanoic acid synthase [Paracoccus methylovorus]|uniref:Polyhydroxyalkanoic acid synthase n=1 Tax=Paracoccus methylovorus TaxID=2812658 RepID=A0ABX7JS94_9RHOB|nr:alpha/beta fold hydrolase [Paracoccus methylovorus]QRZ15879.1 polyhydroxyalkanoic acid synthase [Paracoccus methylovorus]
MKETANLPESGSTGTNITPYRAIDRLREATVAGLGTGISPLALGMALIDWSAHLAAAPGKRMELAGKATQDAADLMARIVALTVGPKTQPTPQDPRFADPAWRNPPFSIWAHGFLLAQQWWQAATSDVPGVDPHHESLLSATAQQWLDMVSPATLPLTNPEVIVRSIETGGLSHLVGLRNWFEDMAHLAANRPPVGAERFRPGHEVATTPGKVVFRNHLIELIQYAPATETVLAEPVLLVPAWIMKYYVLDLSPENSLVRHLVQAGHTVFCLSWRNPTAEDRDLTLDDYRNLGIMAAVDAISAVLPGQRIHAAGYCLGGTLLAIAAAAMAGARDNRLATVSLLAAQTDFTEPGDLALFIDHDQLHRLESVMWQRGYLTADQMLGAFRFVRSNDLVWSRMVRAYLLGEREPMTDIAAWSADSTRMPYRMQGEYLRRLYLENALASDRLLAEGRPVALRNIRAPIFAVGTEDDYVTPWSSVYRLHCLCDAELTFVLADRDHLAGIIHDPAQPGSHYRIATRRRNGAYLYPEDWAQAAAMHSGSWWTAWTDWLAHHSTKKRQAPPDMGAAAAGYPPLGDAPGSYVRQR